MNEYSILVVDDEVNTIRTIVDLLEMKIRIMFFTRLPMGHWVFALQKAANLI